MQEALEKPKSITNIKRKPLNITLAASLIDKIQSESNKQHRKISNYVETILLERFPELQDAI